jgi:hypothetical protein
MYDKCNKTRVSSTLYVLRLLHLYLKQINIKNIRGARMSPLTSDVCLRHCVPHFKETIIRPISAYFLFHKLLSDIRNMLILQHLLFLGKQTP